MRRRIIFPPRLSKTHLYYVYDKKVIKNPIDKTMIVKILLIILVWLRSQDMKHPKNITIIGGGGAIGSAFAEALSAQYPFATITVFSRRIPDVKVNNLHYHQIDYENETSIQSASILAAATMPLDLVLVATGILHEHNIRPEKSLRELSANNFERLFKVNAIVPALIAKYFLPGLNRKSKSVFAVLSARVGSISDNQLGGWYAYRASKSALNMVIKSASIEIARKNPEAIIVGLHPGTVDSNLSKPFQNNVANSKLFSASYSAQQLLSVIDKLSAESTGRCFAWDGSEILP